MQSYDSMMLLVDICEAAWNHEWNSPSDVRWFGKFYLIHLVLVQAVLWKWSRWIFALFREKYSINKSISMFFVQIEPRPAYAEWVISNVLSPIVFEAIMLT